MLSGEIFLYSSKIFSRGMIYPSINTETLSQGCAGLFRFVLKAELSLSAWLVICQIMDSSFFVILKISYYIPNFFKVYEEAE